MPAKLKYGEPTQMISIRVPQSRKEEIRELVRGALNGDDGWVSVTIPPIKGDYIVTDGRYVTCACFDNYGDWGAPSDVSTTYEMSSVSLDIIPTHYRELPQPPKSK